MGDSLNTECRQSIHFRLILNLAIRYIWGQDHLLEIYKWWYILATTSEWVIRYREGFFNIT